MNRRQFFKLTAAGVAVAVTPIAVVDELAAAIAPPPPARIIDHSLWYLRELSTTSYRELITANMKLIRDESIRSKAFEVTSHAGFGKRFKQCTNRHHVLDIDMILMPEVHERLFDALHGSDVAIDLALGVDGFGRSVIFVDGRRLDGVLSISSHQEYDYIDVETFR